MKSNNEILETFGKYVGSDAFDSSYGSIIEVLNGTCPNMQMKDKVELFSRFSESEKQVIKDYVYDLISGTLFDFLRIFEEHPEFKIVYEEDGQHVEDADTQISSEALVHHFQCRHAAANDAVLAGQIVGAGLAQGDFLFGVQFGAVTLANVALQIPVGRATDRYGSVARNTRRVSRSNASTLTCS